jgi:hypothetical protein
LDERVVKVGVDLFGKAEDDVTVSIGGGKTVTGKAGDTITIPVENPKFWTPDEPHLYDMTVTVTRGGKEVDKVGSYFGMRSIRMAEVDGTPRCCSTASRSSCSARSIKASGRMASTGRRPTSCWNPTRRQGKNCLEAERRERPAVPANRLPAVSTSTSA